MGRLRKVVQCIALIYVVGLIQYGSTGGTCYGVSEPITGRDEPSNTATDSCLFFEDAIVRLKSPIRYQRRQAVVELSRADTKMVLDAFKAKFSLLHHEEQKLFQNEVLPGLSANAVDSYLLEEFRSGIDLTFAVDSLRRREKQGEAKRRLEQEYKLLEKDYKWWQWIVRAKGDLSFVPGYDELYTLLLKLPEKSFLARPVSRELYRRDPDRAEKDFSQLLFDSDTKMQLRGIKAFSNIEKNPPMETIRRFYRDADIALQSEATRFFYSIPRNHLDFLLEQMDSPSEQVRSRAEYRLCKLGYLSRKELQEIAARATIPAERAKAWREWWDCHKDATDVELRQHTIGILLKDAEQEITKDLLYDLSRYNDYGEILPIYLRAMESKDIALSEEAWKELRRTVGQGHNALADVFIVHCQSLEPADLSRYANLLSHLKDERIEPLFKKMLDAPSVDDKKLKSDVVQPLGQINQEWATRLLLRLLIDDGDYSAGVALSRSQCSDTIIPELLKAMVREDDKHRRQSIREVILAIGAEGLGEALTRQLPQAAGGSTYDDGVRGDVLKLMESFPDPAAKPLLLDLLESDDFWANLGAARVLGVLNDDSGVDRLITNLSSNKAISASYYHNRIGEALRLIGSPKTKPGLELLYNKGDLTIKKRVLHVMGQQKDPLYLDFFMEQLSCEDTELRHTVRQELGRLICRGHGDEINRQGPFDEEILVPIRRLLLWAFFDEKPLDSDSPFPDQPSLLKRKGAIIRVNDYQRIEFIASERSVQFTEAKHKKDLIASNGTEAGRKSDYAAGRVGICALECYVVIRLGLNYGGASYLFKQEGDEWIPLGPVGGWIE